MKTKIILGLLVACLLGASSVFMFARNDNATDPKAQDAAATVKICPKSGLPCDGGGDCGHSHDGESASCGGGCCASKTTATGCCGDKADCAGCPKKQESGCAGCGGCAKKQAE